MKRIVKEHDERKTEIIEAAQQLFYKHGYDKTSIAMVIDAVGIAKGTFYHYFASKSDLLDAIVQQQAIRIDEIIDRVIVEPEENALVELNNIFQSIGLYKVENRSIMMMMLRAMYNEANLVLRVKLLESRIGIVSRKIAGVIERGIREGIFKTGNPLHMAHVIMNMSTYLIDDLGVRAAENRLNADYYEAFQGRCESYEFAVKRILGIENGTVIIFNRKMLKSFFEYNEETHE